MLSRTVVLSFLLLLPGICVAQAIDNTASFRMPDANAYIRLHYENDFFSGTDLYYTQGINLEVVHPKLKKFVVSKILLSPATGNTNYGVAFEHNGYTPSSIRHDEILYGDRPFAADMFLKAFSFSAVPEKKMRITSSFSLGVIGSAAGGHAMQRTIHRWINGTVPHGWDNQIRNDIVLNYEAGVEKNIFLQGNYLLLNALTTARAGTLSDKLSAGMVLMAGKINSTITSAFGPEGQRSKQHFNFHFYMQPLVNVVLYDATLQGGAFNRQSPYTLTFNQVQHLTFQASYGLLLTYHGITVDYFQTFLTKEFEGTSHHRWGGLRLAVALRARQD